MSQPTTPTTTSARTSRGARPPGTAGWVRAGLLALALYGAVLAWTTRTPQPDQVSDPEGWARFVSSPSYLAEHVASSVVGSVLVVLGTVALGAALSVGRSPRLGIAGAGLALAGQVLFTVPAALSTFATPAIGAAYLAGHREVMAVEFSPVATLVTALGMLLTVAGNVLLGVAVWRSAVLPRWSGLLWLAGTLLFYLLGAALGMATTGASLLTQPVGAALMAVGAGGMALRAYRAAGEQAGRP